MYVPKKMVQNEFKELVCPCPRDLYSRVGARMPNNNGSSDGTDVYGSEVVSFDNNKMRSLLNMSVEDYLRYSDEMRILEESKQPKPLEEENNV